MSLAWQGEPPNPLWYEHVQVMQEPEPLPADPSQPEDSVPARNFRLWCDWEDNFQEWMNLCRQSQ